LFCVHVCSFGAGIGLIRLVIDLATAAPDRRGQCSRLPYQPSQERTYRQYESCRKSWRSVKTRRTLPAQGLATGRDAARRSSAAGLLITLGLLT
jgi:hypothetical protein